MPNGTTRPVFSETVGKNGLMRLDREFDLKTGECELVAYMEETPPDPTPTKLSITLATDSPDWRFTPAVTYDVVTVVDVLGLKGVNAYVLGIGAVDAVTGNPTGGFGLVFKPKIAANAFFVIGPKAFLDSQGRFSAGVIVGFEVLRF